MSCSKSHIQIRISTCVSSVLGMYFSRLSLLIPLNNSNACFSVFRWELRRPLQSFQCHRRTQVNERLNSTDRSHLLLLEHHCYGFGSAASFNICKGTNVFTLLSPCAVYSMDCIIPNCVELHHEISISEAKLCKTGIRMSELRFCFRNRIQADSRYAVMLL